MSEKQFWTTYQPGFRFTDAEPGTPEFYEAVEQHRYLLEPHIPEVAKFDSWRERDVLDVGCGVATDGVRFARAGAKYVGVDQSPAAVELARRRFQLEGLPAQIEQSSATQLPFPDEQFDLVWSHGVIHHFADTAGAVAEFRRVLRPGGKAIVMLYHRDSFNYLISIMFVRRVLAALLLVPGGRSLVAAISHEDSQVLDGHRALLKEHGVHYLVDRGLFLSNNTDGPGNPLSKVYSKTEANTLFDGWSRVSTCVRYLNARLYPGGQWFEQTRLGMSAARRFGWHLYVVATK